MRNIKESTTLQIIWDRKEERETERSLEREGRDREREEREREHSLDRKDR
jgi:hypothetical protein